ncbi:MAG TPA: FAD-dependent oxidoreductase [Nitrospirales bacterium]|nr:FAD-dependent oxidoreductase [Nitrospirales bacterium]
MNDVASEDQGSGLNAIKASGYRVRLIARREVAQRTMALYFARPAGFSFKAGQFIDLTLLDPPETDSEGNTRAFTLAGAPSEEHLMVVTRLRDTAFKRVLNEMPFETVVNIEGPFGNLTLPETVVSPLVFLAGGIGITPFRSMLVQAATQHLPHRLVLFYSNRHPEDAPFLHELQDLQRKISSYTFVATMTQMEESDDSWTGETGYLDHAMLTRHLQGIESPLYYIVGPPAMVKALRAMLKNAGVRQVDIRTEEFAGY